MLHCHFELESGGLNYPKSITVTKYTAGAPAGNTEGGNAEEGDVSKAIATIEQFDIEEFVVNAGVGDEEFVLDFPPETRVVDKANGGQYIVNSDGALEDLAKAMKHPVLSPEKYTWEEAQEILREHKEAAEGSYGGNVRSWAIAANVAIVCLLFGYFLHRQYRLSRHRHAID